MNEHRDKDSPPDRPQRASLWFQLTALSAAVFLLTVFALVATAFGDQTRGAAKWFNTNASQLIALEVVVTLALGFVAMAHDRRQAVRDSKQGRSDEKAQAK